MSVAGLKDRLMNAEADREHYKSLVDSFFTGEAKGTDLEHVILAQWGRKRLEEKRVNKLAVLLAKPA